MKLFKTESGLIYHTCMYKGTMVVFFMDDRDAKKLKLNIIETDELDHAAVSYEEVKNLPLKKWKDLVYWPQGMGIDGDDCEVILAEVSLEDAAVDDKYKQFCTKSFYEFEVAWDGEIV